MVSVVAIRCATKPITATVVAVEFVIPAVTKSALVVSVAVIPSNTGVITTTADAAAPATWGVPALMASVAAIRISTQLTTATVGAMGGAWAEKSVMTVCVSKPDRHRGSVEFRRS